MYSDSKQFIKDLENTLKENSNYEDLLFDTEIYTKRRLEGGVFSFKDHIKGMIYSMLSNQRPWKPISDNLRNIDKIFFEYKKDSILKTNPNYFVDKLKEIKCGNRAISKQMDALRYNIKVFEKIEDDYGTLDSYILSKPAEEVVNELANDGIYKLKQIGVPLAYEYLRNVGIDAAKPDVHICRILGANRLGYSKNDVATIKEAIEIIHIIAKESETSVVRIDALLWNLCSIDYGNICGAAPKCKVCKLSMDCNKGIKFQCKNR